MRPEFRSDLDTLEEVPRYILRARLDPQDHRVDGEMELTYTNTRDQPLTELVFRLYPNAKSIYGGGSLQVENIQQGQTALSSRLSQDDTVLQFTLQPQIQPAGQVTVSMDFTAQAPVGSGQGYGIYNQLSDVMALAGWYPVLAPYENGWQTPDIPVVGDAMLAETSLFDVTLTYPQGYTLVSTGSLASTQEQPRATSQTTSRATPPEGLVTRRIVSGPAREFALSLSQRYRTLERDAGGVRLRLHVLPDESPLVSAEKGLDLLAQAFQTYVRRYGPYPYNELEVAEAAITIGGYEFPGMALLDDGLRSTRGLADYRYILVHELAHQWWYGLTGSHTIQAPWLDEGHATYSAVIFLEDNLGEQAGQRLLANWKSTYGEHRRQDPPVNSSALEFTNWAAYREIVYIDGAFFLDQLRQELGDDQYFELEQRYQQRYRYQTGGTQAYLSLAEEIAGHDMQSFFSEWFDLQQNQ